MGGAHPPKKKSLTQNVAGGKSKLNKRPFVGPTQTPPPFGTNFFLTKPGGEGEFSSGLEPNPPTPPVRGWGAFLNSPFHSEHFEYTQGQGVPSPFTIHHKMGGLGVPGGGGDSFLGFGQGSF